jgi:hypothetical protein
MFYIKLILKKKNNLISSHNIYFFLLNSIYEYYNFLLKIKNFHLFYKSQDLIKIKIFNYCNLY